MPIPTRRPSTPQSMRFFACRTVTTFPPTTSSSGNSSFIHLTIWCWKMLSPWLLSTTMASTPAATRALTRTLSEGRVPTDAATRRLLFLSFTAIGNSAFLLRSFRAMSDTSRPAFETMGNLPFLDLCTIWFAAASSTPSSAVTRSPIFVMMELTMVESRSVRKSVSRRVTRPSSLVPILPSDVTGKPVKPHCLRSSSSCERSIVGLMQTGSVMKPLLYFLTLVTSSTWSSTDMFGWITPMPPSRAMPIAILDSVTVSMGLETIGVFSLIFFVN
mmetsp:Transcript_13051/g.37023  ORF Transcript_13051/g.37023 Transcript_13051/m.37023 type:complete len:273 (-) Transcript_13051:257-1075(-)